MQVPMNYLAVLSVFSLSTCVSVAVLSGSVLSCTVLLVERGVAVRFTHGGGWLSCWLAVRIRLSVLKVIQWGNYGSGAPWWWPG